MKILAISHSCVADVNQQLFVELNSLPDVSVELVIPSHWKGEYSNKAISPCLLPAVNFPVHQLPVAVPGHVSLHFYKQLPLQRLRDFRPDVVLSTQEPWSLSNFQALWLAKVLNAKFVFQTNQNIFKRYPLPFSWLERFSYAHAAVGLAYSEEARQVLLRKGFRHPTDVLPYGTDVSLFAPGVALLRDELGLGTSLVIGYMGRLVPEKGLDTLVQAAVNISHEAPEIDWKVLLVGSGSEEANLKRMAAEAGVAEKFVFAGSVPHRQAGELMRCIDIFALPSKTMPNWKEQFGRVIIEAMACQVPVVGSDSGQIPHLIRETGGGLVFREGQADDLAANLLLLIRDSALRERLGKTGSEAVRSRYTYEAVARRLWAILTGNVPPEATSEPREDMVVELSRP